MASFRDVTLYTDPTPAECRASFAKVYNTHWEPDATKRPSLLEWHRRACPWEVTRQTGFLKGFGKANDALEYAQARACPAHWSAALPRLAGLRLFVVGGSVLAQLATAILCSLRDHVVEDGMQWLDNGRGWDDCGRGTDIPFQHCTPNFGSIVFKHDVVITYFNQRACVAMWTRELFGELAGPVLARYPPKGGRSASRLVLLISTGLNTLCNDEPPYMEWARLNASGLNRTGLPDWPVEVLYKDMDAQHFPTKSGEYDAAANKTDWSCTRTAMHRGKTFRAEDGKIGYQHGNRIHEEMQALPVANALGWRVIETFKEDSINASDLHSTHVQVGAGVGPVDCSHWLLPGVPDVWAAKVLHELTAAQDGRRRLL